MKYMTSGDIHRMFKQEDEGTIIRRNNVRRIALENGIKNTLTQNIGKFLKIVSSKNSLSFFLPNPRFTLISRVEIVFLELKLFIKY